MKQTVTSKYEPKSKNVTWIDMSTGSPVLKNFINGMWRPTGGSGGGAGSSNPTEADATKVWQVTPVLKETKTEETVIVPEQTLVDGQDLEYNDKFVLGAQCVAVANGVEYRGKVVEDKKDSYIFEAEFGGFVYNRGMGVFQFYKNTEPEVTASLSVIEEVPDYDYNWAPGVKIPIPAAEDEGKILVVTKVEGDTSIIVPEQSVSDNEYFQNSDISKFVVGNEVKYTISEGVSSFTKTGLIINDRGYDVVELYNLSNTIFGVIVLEDTEDGKALKFYKPGISFGKTTIKLECIESSYEYQLQENSGGGSNILYCEGSVDRGTVTAYIDSSELENPQITTIAVDTEEETYYFYRMTSNSWLVSEFQTFENRAYWTAQWNIEGQYPTINAYFYTR